MSKPVKIPVKYRTCNCIEVGIDTDGILFALMKMQDKRFQGAVKKCEHWQEGYATAPPTKTGDSDNE